MCSPAHQTINSTFVRNKFACFTSAVEHKRNCVFTCNLYCNFFFVFPSAVGFLKPSYLLIYDHRSECGREERKKGKVVKHSVDPEGANSLFVLQTADEGRFYSINKHPVWFICWLFLSTMWSFVVPNRSIIVVDYLVRLSWTILKYLRYLRKSHNAFGYAVALLRFEPRAVHLHGCLYPFA